MILTAQPDWRITDGKTEWPIVAWNVGTDIDERPVNLEPFVLLGCTPMIMSDFTIEERGMRILRPGASMKPSPFDPEPPTTRRKAK